MMFVRSLLFAAIFYPATAFWVLVGLFGSLFGRRGSDQFKQSRCV